MVVFHTSHSSLPHCPECGRMEKTVTTCVHCGYRYCDDCSDSLVGWTISMIVGTLILGWLTLTILTWVFPEDEGHPTLVQVVQSQWNHIHALRIK